MNISEETIDLYIRGELSGSDNQAFTKAMASDPVLKKEVEFQTDIVNSIKNYRHQQLKSRLDAIEIPAAAPVSNSVYWKFAASLAVVATLIGGTSVWINNSNSVDKKTIVQSSKINGSNSTVLNTDLQINTETLVPVKKEVKSNHTGSAPLVSDQNKPVKKDKNTTNSSAINTGMDEEISMEQSIPDNNTDTDFEVPSINDGNSNSGVQNIKVSIVKEKDLAYRFYNNQLFLHGNFGKSPYELYELNRDPGKRLYLYFDSSYYELIQGKTKVTALTPIKDKAAIDQLNQLRER